MSKSLGQVNAEAHRDESIDWDDMSEWYRGCWQAAAEAVAMALGPQPVIDDLDARMPRAVAERAVIEAAKALHAENMATEDGRISHDVQTRFRLAVEALQEAEGE